MQKKTFPWNRGFYRNMPLRAKLSMRSGVKGGGWRWTVLFSPLNLVSSGFYRRCAMAATSSAEPTKRHALFGVGGNPRGLVIGFPPCRVESVGFPLYFWAPKACRFVGSRFPAPAIREALLGGVVFQDSGCFPPSEDGGFRYHSPLVIPTIRTGVRKVVSLSMVGTPSG